MFISYTTDSGYISSLYCIKITHIFVLLNSDTNTSIQEQNIYNMIPLPIALFIMSFYLDNYNSASTPTFFQLDSWILYTIKSIFEIHFAKIKINRNGGEGLLKGRGIDKSEMG